MKRIIYMCCFSPNEITGGIKTAYRHVEMLMELGFEAEIFQPSGVPQWLKSHAKQYKYHSDEYTFSPRDILVFSEILTGSLVERIARIPSPIMKVMFCQNQYYLFANRMTAACYAKLGFTKFITPGHVSKRVLESVLKLTDVSVIPCFVDTELFSQRDKTMKISTIPHKLPKNAALIQSMLHLKYPHLKSMPWTIIQNKSEEETAELMGQSTILLSMSHMEGCPLVPLEAMACGCIVVGYHGYGGLEYATSENGLWFSPEQFEEVVDALAYVVDGLNRGDIKLSRMRENGIATARRYNRQETKAALQRIFEPLVTS